MVTTQVSIDWYPIQFKLLCQRQNILTNLFQKICLLYSLFTATWLRSVYLSSHKTYSLLKAATYLLIFLRIEKDQPSSASGAWHRLSHKILCPIIPSTGIALFCRNIRGAVKFFWSILGFYPKEGGGGVWPNPNFFQNWPKLNLPLCDKYYAQTCFTSENLAVNNIPRTFFTPVRFVLESIFLFRHLVA